MLYRIATSIGIPILTRDGLSSYQKPYAYIKKKLSILIRVPEESTMATRITHYTDVIMTTMASQITSLTVVYSTVYSVADQRKHQSSASLAFVWGIHRDRWIPRTKGQLRGKCFHLMTSSWYLMKGWLKPGNPATHCVPHISLKKITWKITIVLDQIFTNPHSIQFLWNNNMRNKLHNLLV